MTLRIGTLEIPVANLLRAIDWYARAFGLECAWSDEAHAVLQWPQGDGPSLLLVATDDAPRLRFKSTHTGLDHAVVDFETDDLESFHAHLGAMVPGLGPIPAPANDWAPRGFAFDDSEGNRLAVFSYRDRA